MHTRSLLAILLLAVAAPAHAQPVHDDGDPALTELVDVLPVEREPGVAPAAPPLAPRPQAAATSAHPQAPAPRKQWPSIQNPAELVPEGSAREREPKEPVEFERRSPGMFEAGVALTVLAGLGLVFAAVLSVPNALDGGSLLGPIAASALGGLALAGAGVPLLVVGGERVPVVALESAPDPLEPWAQLRVGAGSLSLSVEF
jgi:hypothetical protein